MITKIQTLEQIKALFLEILINKTDKLSDISDNSILNATAYGVSKVTQKALKDIAIIESHIFPDSAYGVYLDNAAVLFGVPARFGESGSSTFIRLVAEPGTQYIAGVNNFSNYNGIQFELIEDVLIGDLGWEYAAIRSIGTGKITNVEPNSIINISPVPVGHIGCANEYQSIGGRDDESDELLRLRIKKHLNILSRGTLDYLTEIFREYNDNVLLVKYLGINEVGKRELAVVLQNGQSLTDQELDDLLDFSKEMLPISDLNVWGDSIGIQLVNITWEYIDIDFRVQISSSYDVESVRKNIQTNLTKYVDFRFWDINKKVEWDDLLGIVKGTEGVKYVSDKTFLPQVDKTVPISKLPRIRGFIMRNLEGSVISDNNNNLLPIFYPV